ncbi:ABC transporter substrate-binding protein [Corynebacterium mendelii]|uniref:Extracellular solute-binding protein n=1 Tax=Corynebacterium mendelii TaxID=2765362 RepID=A0A939E2G2_9CORY|nr:extracellular solute-binding protein [Corynebacterium mendelii]MBN9645240.1 extracellular solute-binding protein [Corynebacterium mendelii]
MRDLRSTTRLAAVLAAGALATTGLVACSSDDASDAASDATSAAKEAASSAAEAATSAEKTTEAKDSGSDGAVIEYWHRLPDKDGMITVAESAEEWNKEHPDMMVKTVKFEGDATASYDKISAAVKAGNAPCLAQASYDGIPAMLVRGELMDVTDLAAKYKDNYGAGPFGQVTLGGKTYGLPQDTGPLVYYYDKAAFDELGLKPPATWDEYWSNAEKAHDAGKYTSAFFKDEAGDWYGAVNASYGDQWFGVDGDAWKVDVNGPMSQKIAKAWQTSIEADTTLVADRWGDPSPTDTALKDGTLIGYIGAAWEAAFNLDPLGVDTAEWQVAQMPDNTSGPWGGSALVVLKGCEAPEAAMEYANWYNTNLKAMASQGLVPAAKGKVETPEAIKALYGGQDVMAELTKAADNANPNWLFSPTWPAVKKTLIDNAGKGMPLPKNIDAAQEQAVSSLEGRGLAVKQ